MQKIWPSTSSKKFSIILCHDSVFRATIDCYNSFRFWGSLSIRPDLARRRAAAELPDFPQGRRGSLFGEGFVCAFFLRIGALLR